MISLLGGAAAWNEQIGMLPPSDMNGVVNSPDGLNIFLSQNRLAMIRTIQYSGFIQQAALR